MADMISLSVTHGDNKTWPITWVSSGSPSVIDITGATFKADIRKEYGTAVLGSFTITETDLSIASFSLVLDDVTCAALPQNTKGRINSFVFDVEITYTGSPAIKETIISGYLKVANEVSV